jgi:hypothetical protein
MHSGSHCCSLVEEDVERCTATMSKAVCCEISASESAELALHLQQRMWQRLWYINGATGPWSARCMLPS